MGSSSSESRPLRGLFDERAVVPSAPYARGGHHLSNGPTWIEQLAQPLGLSRSVNPAFRGSNPFAMNFAVGTARARNDFTNPSLSLLVSAFLQKTGGVAQADALYVIQIGANDVRDAPPQLWKRMIRCQSFRQPPRQSPPTSALCMSQAPGNSSSGTFQTSASRRQRES